MGGDAHGIAVSARSGRVGSTLMEEMEPKDKADEIVEHRREGFNRTVAVVVALIAAFATICRVKDERITEYLLAAQARELDAWNYYQAESIKKNIYGLQIEQWDLLQTAGLQPANRAQLTAKVEAWKKQQVKYTGEQAKASGAAKTAREDYERLEAVADRLHLAEGMLGLAIALFAVATLVESRPLFGAALLLAIFGLAVGLMGVLSPQGRPLGPVTF
jgi:hypothetical protein